MGASRGAGLDEDFVSHPANEPNEEGSPHRSRGRGVVSDVHQLAETRLSDVSDEMMLPSSDPHRVPHFPQPSTHPPTCAHTAHRTMTGGSTLVWMVMTSHNQICHSAHASHMLHTLPPTPCHCPPPPPTATAVRWRAPCQEAWYEPRGE